DPVGISENGGRLVREDDINHAGPGFLADRPGPGRRVVFSDEPRQVGSVAKRNEGEHGLDSSPRRVRSADRCPCPAERSVRTADPTPEANLQDEPLRYER